MLCESAELLSDGANVRMFSSAKPSGDRACLTCRPTGSRKEDPFLSSELDGSLSITLLC